MKSLSRHLLLAVLTIVLALCARAATADSPELVQVRADLVEHFKRGETDEDNGVKQLRAKIAALEFIAQNSPVGGDASVRLISVNFPGGPFSSLVAEADKTSASGFNVIGEKADLAIELPPFSIRNADAGSLASALDSLLQPRGYTLQQTSRSSTAQAPVFTLRKVSVIEIANQASYLAQRSGQFQSFQLGNYLGEQTVDDIVGAIRTAWELDPSHSPAALRLKFHPPTGILLVSGPPEGINLVNVVLSQLRRNPPPSSPVKTSTAEGHDEAAAPKAATTKK